VTRRAGPEALAPAARVVLDVRDDAAFAAGHLAGSGHVPRSELGARRAELPPRDSPVLVAADDPALAAAAAAELEAAGFREVAWLHTPLGSLPDGHADRRPSVPLWRPARFLEEVLPAVPRGLAADLAAGAGREAVYLALHGFEVEAFDRDEPALERAAAIARRSGVSIQPVVADLERLERNGPPLAPGRYQLITVFRYLHRPLFPTIERALAPGGWLVYETYREGQERFGRPKRARFLLGPGELSSAFPGLSVVRYEEPEPDGGPVTARLLAFKPGDLA